MPTCHGTGPAGLLDAAKKAAIARKITRIHNAVTRTPRVVTANAGTHKHRPC
ncbi:phenylpyruvate tautomerase PptA (4-oxalocrotonate tautomerase family) [Afipia massiliensis]|uniref:Phenylpyruvate tautomerase PptA (4-oxalocrotonate tautomerase family) n=1 Tax=Afipia massiliensis TaxID=211460 RepID=A0A840NBX1_9BRAD|nr:hypothetical protein [Afipia massiliensis]MBB5054176.1 phenylpyruvate tautomerase PptA (4-oxalocrotonate tautomerase family) [Afipia massiliensis]